MEHDNRGSLVAGGIMIVVGLVLLAAQLVPGLRLGLDLQWPMAVIAVGLVFLLFAVLARTPGLAVPGCVIGGIGLLLSWQNSTGHWESWAYAWTLIAGFAGVGVILQGLLSGKPRLAMGGVWSVLISALLFGIFASFLGGPQILGRYWPVLLIVLGLLMFAEKLASG